MIKVEVYNPHEFAIAVDAIKSSITSVLREKKIDDIAVSVAVVNEEEMKEYVQTYYDPPSPKASSGQGEHPVLSFPNREITGKFVGGQDIEDLGEIILSFNYAHKEAMKADERVDKFLVYWARHGVLHLLGEHHN